MKYYLYISDAKLDVLYPQVPHDLKKRVATKFGIDLKFITATRQAEHETEENRLTKLETVVEHIREHQDVGTVDEPGEYVEDTLMMRWAKWGLPVKPGRGPFVYFGGRTANTHVGLWGAMKHVVGFPGDVGMTPSTSCATFVIWELIQTLDKDAAWDGPASEYESETESLLRRARDFRAMNINLFQLPPSKEHVAVMLANGEMSGLPEQRLQFMAKRLLSEPPFLLGTPLFVALAE